MNNITVKDKTFRLLYSESELREIAKRIAKEIEHDLSGEDVLFLVMLNGAFLFAADVLRHITMPVQISFVKYSSYDAMQSTGKLNRLIGLNETIAGRHVIVLEDIIETGGTMQGLLDELQKEHPASLRIASLFFKPECLKKDIKIDYIGKEIGKEFIVGYGLDYAGYGRNYPNIYVANEE